MKTDLLQSCGHCWAFQICWHIKCSTFTASSFRIWNSSTGIPSHPLALFIVMLSKAHLTSHSRMSGSRWVWVITPSWLSGSWRSFLYSFSVFSCHLFNIFCFCYVHTISVLYWACLWVKYSLLLPLSHFSHVRLCATPDSSPLPHPWESPRKNTGVGCQFLLQCMKVKSESGVAQLCPTLSDPMDHSLPGSSIPGIFQARVLEWGTIVFPWNIP